MYSTLLYVELEKKSTKNKDSMRQAHHVTSKGQREREKNEERERGKQRQPSGRIHWAVYIDLTAWSLKSAFFCISSTLLQWTRAFLINTTTDTRELGNFLTFKPKHPDMSYLNAASGCFCIIPSVPRRESASFFFPLRCVFWAAACWCCVSRFSCITHDRKTTGTIEYAHPLRLTIHWSIFHKSYHRDNDKIGHSYAINSPSNNERCKWSAWRLESRYGA